MWTKQLFRFAVVGVATNGGGFLLYYLFTRAGASPVVAISILYPLQIALSFVLNRRWSFAARDRWVVPAVKYLLAYAVCYGVNAAALAVFVDKLGAPHLAVQAIAIPVIAVLLFLAQRYWVFGTPHPPASIGSVP